MHQNAGEGFFPRKKNIISKFLQTKSCETPLKQHSRANLKTPFLQILLQISYFFPFSAFLHQKKHLLDYAAPIRWFKIFNKGQLTLNNE